MEIIPTKPVKNQLKKVQIPKGAKKLGDYYFLKDPTDDFWYIGGGANGEVFRCKNINEGMTFFFIYFASHINNISYKHGL